MARKGLLTSVIVPEEARSDAAARADYARRGASRAMMMSLDEIAQNSSRLLEGEAIVSLETALIDDSPVADRMAIDDTTDEDYRTLVEAIRTEGQTSPVLVRPHPVTQGRYMIVFGRRRLRAARELGIPLRAVIKPMEDVAAIIAQGQENSARADLTFIERAQFARKLLDLGHSKETVKAALTVDDTLLSRMLSITEIIPQRVIEAVGPGKGVGRDRWETLKKLLLKPAIAQEAERFVASHDFRRTPTEYRFSHLLTTLTLKHAPKPRVRQVSEKSWKSPDHTISGRIEVAKKRVSIQLSGAVDNDFGVWLSENLDQLYRNYRSQDGD